LVMSAAAYKQMRIGRSCPVLRSKIGHRASSQGLSPYPKCFRLKVL
jgi:hypothetical protein